MKRSNAMLCILAGALPLCWAAFWPARGTTQIDGSAAMAQSAPTQPPQESESNPPLRQGGIFGSGRRPLMDYLRWQALSPRERELQAQNEQDEWNKLVEFLHDNCPNRELLLIRQSPGPNSPIRLRLLVRWQNMMQLQRTHPDLYDLRVQQFRQEDLLIGLAAQLRQARVRHDTNRIVELRRQIQQGAADLVDINLRQRRMSLDNAQAALNLERDILAKEEANKSQISQARARQVMTQFERSARANDAGTNPSPDQ